MSMAKCGIEGRCVSEAWLQDLVEEIIRYSKVRNTLEALSTEIPRNAKEIRYMEALKEADEKRLSKAKSAIADIRERLEASKRSIIPLRKEKAAIAEKYMKLAAVEKDVEEKRAALSETLSEIRKMRRLLDGSSQTFSSLKRTHREILGRKEHLDEERRALNQKLSLLDLETSAMNSTFSLIMGVQPEGFDFDTFQAVQEDLETKVADFTHEMTEEIEKVRKDTTLLKRQLSETREEEQSLLSREKEIRDTVNALKSQTGGYDDLEALTSETRELEKQERQLTISVSECDQKRVRFEKALAAVNERLTKEKNLSKKLNERHAYLMEVKGKRDGFQDPEEEIRRMAEKTRGLEIAAKAEEQILELLLLLSREADPVIEALGISLRGYNELVGGLETRITRLLSP